MRRVDTADRNVRFLRYGGVARKFTSRNTSTWCTEERNVFSKILKVAGVAWQQACSWTVSVLMKV